jgi:hypothetical protein
MMGAIRASTFSIAIIYSGSVGENPEACPA